MRVFKTALGVLALTLGVGLSGSVKAETLAGQGHRRNRRFSGVFQDFGRRGKSGWIGGYTERKGTIDGFCSDR